MSSLGVSGNTRGKRVKGGEEDGDIPDSHCQKLTLRLGQFGLLDRSANQDKVDNVISEKIYKNRNEIWLLLLSLWSTTFASAISPVNIIKDNIQDKEKLGKLT